MISGVVLARNEERNIVDCLEALAPHVEEILLIDMESSDRTVELARPLVAKVLTHPLVPYFDAARNVAIAEAKYDWLWFVDADERIPIATGRMARQLVATRSHEFEAVNIPFKSYFCGRWMQHCGWWPGYTGPRLLKRGHFRYPERLHGGVEHDGRSVRIPPDPALGVDHFSYRDIAHYIEKLNNYTSTEARQLADQGKTWDWQDAMRHMIHDLWWYYEQNPGQLDGEHGWILSWLSGQYRWLSHAKLLDHDGTAGSNGSPPSIPPSLDAVVELFSEELARLRAPQPQLPLGIVFHSPIWDRSGYADEGRAIAKALATGERHLALREIGWSDDRCELAKPDSALLTALERARRPRYSVAITNCIPSLVEPDPQASINVIRVASETDRVPSNWLPTLERFDEVWVWSQASAVAFRRCGVAPEKTRVVPSCLDTDVFRPAGEKLELPSSLRQRFVFLSVFDWQLRKGWDVLLKAYCRICRPDDGCSLLLKITRNHGHSLQTVQAQINLILLKIGETLEDRPDIVIWDKSLSQAELAALYRSVDAFVLPSRGEAWGRPYMEAMACGLPTIGTHGSGNSDFMNDDNSFLVRSQPIDVSPEAAAEIPVFAGHRWLEPDQEHLEEGLRWAKTRSTDRDRRAARAASDVAAEYSLERMQQRIEYKIADAERRFLVPTLPTPTADQLAVELEGEFFARHSFSVVNEKLATEFLKDESLAFTARRATNHPTFDRDAWRIDGVRGAIDRPQAGRPRVTIRHAFPPNWTPPKKGAWIHIQPWEYGYLPVDWIKPINEQVDEAWVPSRYVRDVYLRSGVTPSKVKVIPWGVDPAVFSPQAPPSFLPTDKKMRFLFVGGTIHRKGIDLVLAAFKQAFGPQDDVCLVVKDMGTDSFYPDNYRETLLADAQDARNPQIIYFDKHLTEGQLVSLYTACHCLVAPYRGEGFGLPILEAMACGLVPIIPRGGPTDDFATDEDAIFLQSDIVETKHTWPLCGPPTEFAIRIPELAWALRYAYENQERIREMGLIGSQRIREQFTWSHTAATMRARIAALTETSLIANATGSDQGTSPGPLQPNLSLCMIVRDNEQTLRAALESVRPWVDEMIVVDTGSKDRTPEIARELGARVFDFPWCDSFSAARNESLRHAHGKWLFWMDSDDTIDPANGAKLRDLTSREFPSNVLAHVLKVHCPGSGENRDSDITVVDHVKVFRNHPRLRFEGRIHEQIMPAINRLRGEVHWTDIFVVHSGYDHSPPGQKRKRARDLHLLELELAEQPFHPFTLFNLGMTYSNIERHAEAVEYLRRSIAYSGESESHLPKAYALLVYSLKESGQHDLAGQVCEDALRRFPDDMELRFRQGVLWQNAGRLQEASAAYEAVLATPAIARFSSIDRGICGFKTRHNLAILYAEMQDWDRAEGEWRKIVADEPTYRTGWRGLGALLIGRGKLDEARLLAEQLDQERYFKGESHLLKASIAESLNDRDVEERELAAAVAANGADIEPLRRQGQFLFQHRDPDTAAEVLEKLIDLDPTDAAAFQNLGTLHLRANRFAQAIEEYRKALTLRPNGTQTWLYLSYALDGAGRDDDASDALRTIIDLAPASADAQTAQNLLEVRQARVST